MPAERSDFVALDLTREQVRGYGRGRVIRAPAAVFGGDGGSLAFGAEAVRRGLTEPARLEPRLLDWVDDEHLALGSRLFEVGDLLRALLWHVMGEVRTAAEPTGQSAPELLVVTVPECWGGPRRVVVERAAAGLARRVELASSATAILAGALLDFPELDLRKVVVVEQERDRALAAVVANPTALLPTERNAPTPQVSLMAGTPCGTGEDVDMAVVGELVARAAGPGLAESALVIAPRGGRELPAALWRAAPGHARVVDGDCALRGAVAFARKLSSQL